MSKVLVVGDLHEPFCLDGYLQHCKKVYKKEKCTKVIFIGDIIDNHYSSYHETDPDGMSARDELELAISKVAKWVKAFPIATVTLGNHDLIVQRKAFSAGLCSKWIRSFNEVLEAPLWNFVEEIELEGITYCHGTGKKARKRASDDMVSYCQGHYHTDSYVEDIVGNERKVVAIQVPCGIDRKSYAMAYGKHFPKPVIGCTVVYDGEGARNFLMKL